MEFIAYIPVAGVKKTTDEINPLAETKEFLFSFLSFTGIFELNGLNVKKYKKVNLSKGMRTTSKL